MYSHYQKHLTCNTGRTASCLSAFPIMKLAFLVLPALLGVSFGGFVLELLEKKDGVSCQVQAENKTRNYYPYFTCLDDHMETTTTDKIMSCFQTDNFTVAMLKYCLNPKTDELTDCLRKSVTIDEVDSWRYKYALKECEEFYPNVVNNW